ncbi:MAG TPA: double zinc ribbon domain-containing protein, partial [Sedimentisphaerales bacterium]|nr:double zinc ribbon domain-containing protein [Sedimentisphaerales bacterium]
MSGTLRTVGSGIRIAATGFARLLWPPVCQNCRRPTTESTGLLCRDCWDDILKSTASPYCPRCGHDAGLYAIHNGSCSDCKGHQFHFDGIARAGVHEAALQRMIVAFKAADRTDLDPHFRLLINSALAAAPFRHELEYLVPVPLHWTRRLSRGYNHAHLLAKVIDHSKARINSDLVRIRKTRPQPTLTVRQRALNVKEAFAVRKGHPFAGSIVCLVDDVKTTGATLNECAWT